MRLLSPKSVEQAFKKARSYLESGSTGHTSAGDNKASHTKESHTKGGLAHLYVEAEPAKQTFLYSSLFGPLEEEFKGGSYSNLETKNYSQC